MYKRVFIENVFINYVIQIFTRSGFKNIYRCITLNTYLQFVYIKVHCSFFFF